LILLFSAAMASLLSGCASVPERDNLAVYKLNGTSYLSLAALCDSLGINYNYDTFSKAITLTKDAHKIDLMAGQSLVVVDAKPMHFRYPVDTYNGAVVVPERFKADVLDALFKDAYTKRPVPVLFCRLGKVVVDAGHGGNDPGTIGKSGLREKDVNLDIAKRVSRLLRSSGIEVVMTRSTDTFISLESRVQRANDCGADLFLSIHSNANRVRNLNGFEVYYVAPSVDDNRRAQLASGDLPPGVDSRNLYQSSANLKAILWDMVYSDSRAESMECADALCQAIGRNLDTKVLGAKGKYSVGHFKFMTSMRHIHTAETYGLRFNMHNTSVSLLADTKYFAGLADFYRTDILIINLVFFAPRPGVDHLSLSDAEQIISQVFPKKAILTHFGMTMLASGPKAQADILSKRLGIEVIAAYDGMKIEFS